MSEMLIEQYKNLGISEEVYRFGAKIEEKLKDRFTSEVFSSLILRA